MAEQFLFDSRGAWIAFRIGDNVFDAECNWLGWMPWPGYMDVVSVKGEYLGTICDDNRLYRLKNRPFGYTCYPGYPDKPIRPGNPRPESFSPLPTGAEDVVIPKTCLPSIKLINRAAV